MCDMNLISGCTEDLVLPMMLPLQSSKRPGGYVNKCKVMRDRNVSLPRIRTSLSQKSTHPRDETSEWTKQHLNKAQSLDNLASRLSSPGHQSSPISVSRQDVMPARPRSSSLPNISESLRTRSTNRVRFVAIASRKKIHHEKPPDKLLPQIGKFPQYKLDLTSSHQPSIAKMSLLYSNRDCQRSPKEAPLVVTGNSYRASTKTRNMRLWRDNCCCLRCKLMRRQWSERDAAYKMWGNYPSHY